MATTLARLNVIVGADISRLDKQLGKVTSSVKRTGQALTQVGQKLTATVTLPIVALGAAATKMASDAAEAANKFDVVFGGAAESVSQEIERLRQTIPAARFELQGMAAGVQDLLVPLGLSGDAAADMSIKILELAGDLASFNNLRVTDVLRDIRSGLVGQSEPLLKFGADTRVAAVEAKALELGLIREGEELTNAARAMAVYNIVLDSNVAAQGDAARTAGEAANTFKFFVAEVKDLAVSFGQVLLPVITPLVQQLRDMLQRITDLPPETKQFIAVIATAAAVVGPLVFVLGQLSTSMIALATIIPKVTLAMAAFTGSLLTNPAFLAIAAGIAAVGAAIAVLRRDAENATTGVREFGKSLKGSAKLARELDEALQGIDTPQFEVFTAERELQRARNALRRFREDAGIEGPGIDISVRPEVLGKLFDLTKAVTEAKRRVDDARTALEAFGKEKAAAANAEALAKRTKQIADVFKQLESTLHVARANAQLFGDEFDFTSARLSAFESALQSLLEIGLKPTDAAVVRLAEKVRMLREDFGGIEETLKRVEGVPVLARFTDSALEASLGFGTLRGKITAATGATREFGEVNRDAAMIAAQAWLETQTVIDSFKQLGVSTASRFADAIGDFAAGSKDAFADFVDSAIRDLTRLLAKLLVFKTLDFLIPGFGSLVGGFAGFFGSGGSLRPGQFGIAGESGAELVIGGTAGASIEPADNLALRVDTSSLPPPPRAVSPDALAVDDFWRQAFSALVLDANNRGARLA